MIPCKKSKLTVSFPSHELESNWVEWRNGVKVGEISPSVAPDPLIQVSCGKCGHKNVDDDIKILSKYGYSYCEVSQGAGEFEYMEINCQKCNKYTIWVYEHTYWSSYH